MSQVTHANHASGQDPQAQIAALMAEVARLKAQAPAKRGVGFKLSEKGCILITGLRRFPIALYPQEVAQILQAREALEKFIQDNAQKIASIPRK